MLSLLSQPLDGLPPRLAITPIAPAGQTLHPFNITIRPPGSKSLTNRALLLASLARGTSIINKAELIERLSQELSDANSKVIVILITDKKEGKYSSLVMTLGLSSTYEAYGILDVAKQDLQNGDY